eukprot:365747-Chlamydomonas_euryale.AAC.26
MPMAGPSDMALFKYPDAVGWPSALFNTEIGSLWCERDCLNAQKLDRGGRVVGTRSLSLGSYACQHGISSVVTGRSIL